LEEKNFWFHSRNKIIQILVKKYFLNSIGNFLEIGCGTGYVLKGLEKFKNLKLYGAEIYLEGLKYAKLRLPNIEFIQLDARKLPFENEYDCIGAFDVLEHINEDELVIENVFKSLKPGGYFFITVPQYMFMWSAEDDKVKHKRRYKKKELIGKLKNARFYINYYTSFVFMLFPLMYFSRAFLKNKKKIIDEHNSELNLNPIINVVFSLIMKIDEFLIKLGFKLPWGGSLIVVGKKVK